MGFVVSMFWTLIVVGVIIFFHELGHFLGCKKVGIKVERFSIGFGPKMVGFTRGDTEYRISWLPMFGGYVKMLGENPAERPDEGTTGSEEGRFDLAPVSHRVIVAASGPGMNMILAVFAFALAFMVGVPADPDTTIGYVKPDSPASKAGIMRGDKILSVDGYRVKAWGDIQENVITNPDKEIEITLLRDENEEITVRATPEHREFLIISVNLDLQSELDDNTISEDLKREFESNNILLSPDAFVSTEEAGNRWLITDGDRKYPVRKEENRLQIYQETEPGKIELAFNIHLDAQSDSDLDNRIIPEGLRQEFENSNATLPPDASVLVEETGSRWLITDRGKRRLLKRLIPGKDRRYPIRKEENRLNVYYLEPEFGMIGVIPGIKPIIRRVKQGSVVAEAGLRVGDVVEGVDHNEVLYTVDLSEELQDASGESVTLTVRRNESTIDILVPLEFNEDAQLTSFEGLSFDEVVRRNPIAAFGMAIPETIRMGGKIFQYLKKLIIGDVSPRFLAGPLGITQLAMAVVKTGVASTLRFAGFLSVNLGIVNLLPLFITDGALIVFLIVEKLRGKAMTRKRQLIIQQVGVGFIIFLFLFLTYNDILRWISGPF
jgi:membrane-associated protease RseP (regulator of RpoE activity)